MQAACISNHHTFSLNPKSTGSESRIQSVVNQIAQLLTSADYMQSGYVLMNG